MMSVYMLTDAGAAAGYYEEDNYYAKDSPEAMEPTHWYGRGAEALGLSGYVDKARFVELLEGKVKEDVQLGRKRGGKIEHRPGYDLTFSAPKSVSILAEVGGDTNLHYAHNKAVNVALDFVEKHIAMTRVSDGTRTEFQKEVKCIFAKFRHDTARSVTDDTGETVIDCQLHTHAVLLNALKCLDDQWRSLSSEKIYELKKTVGIIYRSTLAKLIVSYGYEIVHTREDGLFEIKGITREQIEGFSNRRLLITEVMKERGVTGAAAAARVTKDTREVKVEIDRAVQQKEWVKRAIEMKIPYAYLVDNARRNHNVFAGADYQKEREDAVVSLDFAIAHLSETRSVFSRYDIIRAALAHGMSAFEVDMIQEVINTATAHRELIAVSDEHFTSPLVLEKEKTLVHQMTQGKNTVGILTSPSTVALFLDQLQARYHDNNEPGLTPGQQDAITAILTSRDRYTGVQGYAGVGKSTLLSHVVEYTNTAGLPVRFFSTTAITAGELSQSLGVTAQTLSHLIYNVKDIKPSIGTPETWVIDEVGRASTDQLYRLQTLAEKNNKRVIYMGDREQPHGVEGGDPFGLLQDNGLQTVIAKDIVRQQNNDLRIAVKRTIAGDINSAFKKIGDNIVELADKDARCLHVAEQYLALSPAERKAALIVVLTHAERDVINQRIREGLVAPDAKTIVYDALQNKSLSRAQKKSITQYEVGDKVRFNKAYRSLEVKKGAYLQVVDVSQETGIVTLQQGKRDKVHWRPGAKGVGRQSAVEVFYRETKVLAKGDAIRFTQPIRALGIVNSDTAEVTRVTREKIRVTLANDKKVVLDRRKGAHQHWDYAWSSTTAAAQGATCDTVFGIMDSMNRNLSTSRAFYVLISRAKFAAHVVVDNIDKVRQHLLRHHGANENALDYVASFEVQRRFSKGLANAAVKMQGRIHEVDNEWVRLERMATDYMALSKRSRSQTVMLVPGYQQRKITDALVRDKRIAAGEVAVESQPLSCLERQFVRDTTKASDYRVGDVLRITDCTLTLPIEKGGYYEVADVRARQHSLSLVTEDGEIVTLNIRDFIAHKTNQLEVYQKATYPVAAGDTLRWTRTHQDIGAVKEAMVTVTGLTPSTLSVKDPAGKVHTLARDNPNGQHFEYGYTYRLTHTLPDYYRTLLTHVDANITSPLQQAKLLSTIGTPIDTAHVYTHSHAYLADRLNMHTGKTESLQAVASRSGKWDTLLQQATDYQAQYKTVGKAWGAYFQAKDDNLPVDALLLEVKAAEEIHMALATDVLSHHALSDAMLDALSINKDKLLYYADKLAAKARVVDYVLCPSPGEKQHLAFLIMETLPLHRDALTSNAVNLGEVTQLAWVYAEERYRPMAQPGEAFLLAAFDHYRKASAEAQMLWQRIREMKDAKQTIPATLYTQGQALMEQRYALATPLLEERAALETMLGAMGMQEARFMERLDSDGEQVTRMTAVQDYQQDRSFKRRYAKAADIVKHYDQYRTALGQAKVPLSQLLAHAWQGATLNKGLRLLPGEAEKIAVLDRYFTTLGQAQKAWQVIFSLKRNGKVVAPERYTTVNGLNREVDALATVIMADKLTYQSLFHFKLPRSVTPFPFIEKHAARHVDYLQVIEYANTGSTVIRVKMQDRN